MAIEVIDEFTAVVNNLRGSTLRIPSLNTIYGRWRDGFNVHYEKLVEAIDAMLGELFQDAQYINGVKAMDLAQFICESYPLADWPRLLIMGLYLVGLILFDDEFDRKIVPSVADQASDLSLSNKYRLDMYAYVESIFSQSASDLSVEAKKPAPVSGFFAAIAPELKASESVDVPRLLADLKFFMGPSNEEQQRLTIERKFPTLQQYKDFRIGTGAVDSICDLNEFVAGTKLPRDITGAEEVMVMRKETNIQTCVSNDLLSLRKEIEDETLISWVPIQLHHTGASLEEVVDEAVRELTRAADSFDAAAEALRAKAKRHGQAVIDQTNKFILAFETFQTGCFAFYIKSKRFGIADCQLPDGSFIIPLRH